MRRISANLPTLGTVSVDFHKESLDVLSLFGDTELMRLRQVPHLGVAASVFTGVGHSRAEYVLLQCAVVSLVAKLHRHDEMYALSNSVQLQGVENKVSSGEELLKTWILLSNFGHAQYTYGIERTLLQLARRDDGFREWLVANDVAADIADWCRAAVDEYQDSRIHFLISLLRIRELSTADERRARFTHYLRNLLLPSAKLFPESPTARYKLERLRQLFGRIRLLSLVTLDSYYSHHPIRMQLGAAVMNLAEIMAASEGETGFERILKGTAGWLADELYLHPDAVAAQREYERRAKPKIQRWYRNSGSDTERLRKMLNTLLTKGVGHPSVGHLVPLMRLSFDVQRRTMLGRRDVGDALGYLEKELARPPVVEVSVDENVYNSTLHVDLLYDRTRARPSDVGAAYGRVYRWLAREIEAVALTSLRKLYPADWRPSDDRFEQIRQKLLEQQLIQESDLGRSFFGSVVKYVLPPGKHGMVSEFMPESADVQPILIRLRDSKGHTYDQIRRALQVHITQNPRSYPSERLHELAMLDQVVAASDAPLVIACIEKFVVRDELGRRIDDWDGVAIEVDDSGVQLTVVEAKNLAGKRRSVKESFDQLTITAELIRDARTLTVERRDVAGQAAAIVTRIQSSNA